MTSSPTSDRAGRAVLVVAVVALGAVAGASSLLGWCRGGAARETDAGRPANAPSSASEPTAGSGETDARAAGQSARGAPGDAAADAALANDRARDAGLAAPGEAAAVHLDLSRAEATVATQIALLEAGRDEAFRETFLPRARAEVTPAAIARCRARLFVQRVTVRPDWEMGEQDTEDGHPVRRVSMFGHELTGFHDVGGRWLADRVWCVPTAVP